jgi:hypothetical protein
MELEEPWLSQCTLAPEILQVCMDPAMLPKPVEQRGRDVERARKDIKHPHSTFGCIMGNYAYGHLLPDAALRKAGLLER